MEGGCPTETQEASLSPAPLPLERSSAVPSLSEGLLVANLLEIQQTLRALGGLGCISFVLDHVLRSRDWGSEVIALAGLWHHYSSEEGRVGQAEPSCCLLLCLVNEWDSRIEPHDKVLCGCRKTCVSRSRDLGWSSQSHWIFLFHKKMLWFFKKGHLTIKEPVNQYFNLLSQ